jgi:two-component system CheB/CheR fusion protein
VAQDEDIEVAGNAFPVVGVGASAGGVRALQHFFSGIHDKTGAAFVVIVHLDPDHERTQPSLGNSHQDADQPGG